ncbi:hypothetical protein JXQ70_09445 [bacterium]|nr:hypothetical protein [bacterium]
MFQTVLLYSSHSCSREIHEDLIVQRALNGWRNKTILFLPMSEQPLADGNEYTSQHFGYSKFDWFFDQYKHYGLNVIPFYYSSHLRDEDVTILVELLRSAEVTLLGGGAIQWGMKRYRAIGQKFFHDPDLIRNLLHERQLNGLYTAGFSAGAEQLGEYLFDSAAANMDNPFGFGLAHKIVVSTHYQAERLGDMVYAAHQFHDCLVFGLPNDSALVVSQGWLKSGRLAQIIHFVLDKTWDNPRDQYHIKTRQGARIEHYYSDGRHWAFNHDDLLVRICDTQTGAQDGWLVIGGHYINYWSQSQSEFGSIEQILQAY